MFTLNTHIENMLNNIENISNIEIIGYSRFIKVKRKALLMG